MLQRNRALKILEDNESTQLNIKMNHSANLGSTQSSNQYSIDLARLCPNSANSARLSNSTGLYQNSVTLSKLS